MSETALSSIAEINPGARIPKEITDSDEVSFIPMSDVSESGDWITRQTRPLRLVTAGFTAFEEGDVLVAKITPCLENGKGAHARGLRNSIGFGSTEFHVLRAKQGVEPRFVFQITQSRRFRQAAERQMVGSAGQQRVQRQFFDEFLVKDFSRGEQRAIAQILDTLDTTIRKTEALIDKLKAVKQGLLHDLLTRGIDTNGQLRPPQSEAPQLYKESPLGWIPREWVIHAVSDIARVTVGHVGPIEEHFSEGDGSVPLLSTTSIGEDGRLHGELRYVSASFDRTHGNSHLFPADLIVARHGKSGLTAVVPEEISAAQSLNVVIVRASPMFISGFLAASLNHPPTRSRLLGGQAGSVQPIVGTRAVAALEVAMPGREEQLAIWARNEALMTKIDLEVQYVESLRAIKQGLMDDLLTGRVRVTSLLESVQQATVPMGA